MARLVLLNNPGWTETNAEAFVNSLKIVAPLMPSIYKANFLETFKRERDRRLLKTYGKEQW